MKSTLLFQGQEVIRLHDDANEVLVKPEYGACILRWTHRGREIITWPANADWGHIAQVRAGNPILFPFVARHFVDGKNKLWRDKDGVVRRMPQHGFARDSKFAVVEDPRPDAVRMRLTDSAATREFYPFAFQFDVIVTLHPGSGLEVAFETTNCGAGTMPYYAGHHFYLAIPHTERGDWTLDLPCAAWGWQEPDGSIRRAPAGSTHLSLADKALVDRFQIEPGTHAILHNARTGQRLAFDLARPDSVPWYDVTTWTRADDSDFYCVEPWLGLPNAIHHGEGLRLLEPGEMERAALLLDGKDW